MLLKRILSALLMPGTVTAGIAVLGAILLWFGKRQRAGKVLVTVGVGLLALLSTEVVGDLVLGPLERRYPPLLTGPGQPDVASLADVEWVVVLGAGHTWEWRYSVTDQAGAVALARLAEGIRLHRLLPRAKLVVSGGTGPPSMVHAEVVARSAQVLGVSGDRLVREPEALTTEEEARNIRPIVGGGKLVLVTSAAHMRRAMALFEKQGMRPIPAPTDHLSPRLRERGFGDFIPQGRGLVKVERALHEYVGMVWSRLRGNI